MANAPVVSIALWFQGRGSDLARAWRNSRPRNLRAKQVTRYVIGHVGECVLVAGGISFFLGYLTVAEYAKYLRVAPSDLGVDAKAYASIAVIWLLFGSICIALLLGGLYVGCRLSSWSRRSRAKDFILVQILAIVAGVGVVLVFGAIIWSVDGRREAYYGMSLLSATITIAALGLLVGLMLTLGFATRALAPLVGAVMATGFTYITIDGMLSEGRELARYAMELALDDEPLESEGVWLSTFLRPTEGMVTLPDGVEFCGVRVTNHVFLRPPPDPEQGVPETVVVADGAQFVTRAGGC